MIQRYRCGYCGNFCDEIGNVLKITQEEIDKIPKEEIDNAIMVHGECCIEKEEQIRYVTREMALDAGDPDLEGTRY